jgi:shikimate kinase
VLIGPIGAGKSTLGRLLAQRLALPQVAVDTIRWGYYEQIGYDYEYAGAVSGREGFDGTYRYWKRFELYAVERILAEHADCVIDFGGGHSVYEDGALFERAKRALAPFRNVVLILPSPNLDESVSLLRERTKMQPPAPGRIDFVEHFVRHHSNHNLATLTVSTKDRTPEQTVDEILERVTLPPEWRLPPKQRPIPQRTAERATTLLHAGLEQRDRDPETAWRYLDEALAIRRALGGEVRDMAEALRALASVDEAHSQHARARARLAEALALYESAPLLAPPEPVRDHSPPPLGPSPFVDPTGFPRTLEALGRIERAVANWPAARDWYERAAEAWRPFGRTHTAGALKMLSEAAREAGDVARAETAYQGALTVYRDQANRPEIAATQCIGGYLALAQKDLSAARARFTESFALRRDRRDDTAKRHVLQGIAALATAEGATEVAQPLTAAAESKKAPLDDALALAAAYLERSPVHDGDTSVPNGDIMEARTGVA